jgi:hypothetical protein
MTPAIGRSTARAEEAPLHHSRAEKERRLDLLKRRLLMIRPTEAASLRAAIIAKIDRLEDELGLSRIGYT